MLNEPTPPPMFVADDLQRMGLEIPSTMLDALSQYLDHLLAVNKQFNLTGIKDRDEAWRRLIIDSLTVLPALIDLPDGARVADVGTGGGLPGIPVALTCPQLHMTLMDATGKKIKFLEQYINAAGLAHVDTVCDRAETIGQDPAHREQYDVVLCRAVGPMNLLLEYTLPLVKTGGMLLAMKGPTVEAELDEAGDALSKLGAGEVQIVDAYPEGFDVNTVIVCVTKQEATPPEYPRASGLPKQRPL